MRSTIRAALLTAALCLASAGQAATFVIDIDHDGGLGAIDTAGNPIFTYTLAPNAWINHISYDVTIDTNEPSYLNEQIALFGTSDGAEVKLLPAFEEGYDRVGSEHFVGEEDLATAGLDFGLLDDGAFTVQLADIYNDGQSTLSHWKGRFTVDYDAPGAVPEPASWALSMMGVGMLGGALRLSRRSVRPAPRRA